MVRFFCAPQPAYTKLLILGSCLTFLLLLYTVSLSSSSSFSLSLFRSASKIRPSTSCTPSAYSSGKWVYSPRTTNKTRIEDPKGDALEFAGFEGCASSREFLWHLASDNEAQWDRFPGASSWKWDLSQTNGCENSESYGIRELEREENKRLFVTDLVQNGGWLVLGDSITEGHFFSISCSLYPHVIATPDYIKNPYFDRAWPQNLYLNPDSPLVNQINYPEGFNISETPLVTFRRIDLLLSLEELEVLHEQKHSQSADFTLFSNEAIWTMSPSTYVSDIFLSTLPKANYANLIVSTAGHWTTTMFSGYSDETDNEGVQHHGDGIDGLINFFGEAMEYWADHVQNAINHDQKGVVLASGGRARRQAMVRAYLPGHEDCHDYRQPWKEVEPMKWGWYNWGSIWKFNQVFDTLLSKPKYLDIHYLAIDRPARLRPDAHATGDCLHIMAGAGVLEGWTEYIWHYITHFTRERRELGV
ncbi:hypothetical protein DFJ43DRAFT_1002488 [Lentinula guzmanii]|uniref:Uncharacterized protein n=1 Tax=Lentinula guzmanii TaxID=2804957 RepID=A0AA38MXA9_9AGAR|nr:hypothetical protein DFJ43DRAFT_1002488 [Lentinula guzmanii]